MKGLLLDLDGVVYVGDDQVPGAADAVAWLRRRKVPHVFVTNTTSRPRRAIVDRLRDLGVDTDEDRVLTPAVAAGDWLREHDVTRVDVCGLATDHCVRATALDAAREGFDTTVLLDLCAGVAPETTGAALAAMREAGVTLAGD